MRIDHEDAQKDIVEQVIEAMNKEFEYWFEEYPDVDESYIWWVYRDGEYKHVANFAEKEGDLAAHYFTSGYCPLYAQLLSELFEGGQVLYSERHMIFHYNGQYYDAGGRYKEDTALYDAVTLTPTFIVEFCSEYPYTNSNQELCAKMKAKGEEVLKTNKGMPLQLKQ